MSDSAYVLGLSSQGHSRVLYDDPEHNPGEAAQELTSAYNLSVNDQQPPSEDPQAPPEEPEESNNSELLDKDACSIYFEFRSALRLRRGPVQRQRLLALFDRFVSEAEEGLELIAQGQLPRAILGGRAGGAKYIWKSVLFKRADDLPVAPHWYMYGGLQGPCRHWAGKAAANELKASNALLRLFFEENINQVTVPLQILFDYQGERYLAMNVLPLQGSSLVYGSRNGGQTVFTNDEEFNQFAALAGEKLHLAEHKVRKCQQPMWLAGDVEGHRVGEGIYCLIDLARVWPPEDPLRDPPSSIFFRLFRPEFLTYLQSKDFPALSPDALSAWSTPGPELDIHNANIHKATQLLTTERVQDCVKYLEEQLNKDVLNLDRLIAVVPARAADLMKTTLTPISSLIRYPAELLPALNVVLTSHSCFEGGFDGWTPLQLSENPLWAKSYGQYKDGMHLNEHLHKFGIPVRHLSLLLERATSPLLRRHIRLDLVRRSVKTQVRLLLARDKPAAFELVSELEGGLKDPEKVAMIKAIMQEKYGCEFPIETFLLQGARIITEYVKLTCGLDGSNAVKACMKPNTFMAVLRAQYHFDHAIDSTVHDRRMKSLREALLLCSQVSKSDPSDPEALSLMGRCRVLVDLENLRGVSLERADRVALDYSGVLHKWFGLIANGDDADFSLGVDIIGGKRLCLAYAGTLQTGNTILSKFVDWTCPQEEGLALAEAAHNRAQGLLYALFELGLTITQMIKEQSILASQSMKYKEVSMRSFRTPKAKFLVQGTIVVRKPAVVSLIKQDLWADGGEGNLGQVIALEDEGDGTRRCVVSWLATTQIQRCLETTLQEVDDPYLETYCRTGNGKEALAKLNNRSQTVLWKPVLNAYHSFVGKVITENDVRVALHEAWRILCREKDPLALSIVRAHVVYDHEMLRMAIKSNYEDGIVALLRVKESNPYCEEGVQPTLENDGLLYAASLGASETAQLLLRQRPLPPVKRAQVLLAAAALGSVTTKTLLDIGFNVRSVNDANLTALHIAAKANDSACVQLLLEQNAFVNATCLKRSTPLSLTHKSSVQQLLLAAKADPGSIQNGDDPNGNPAPLEKPALQNRLETIGATCALLSEWFPKPKANVILLSTIAVTESLFQGGWVDPDRERLVVDEATQEPLVFDNYAAYPDQIRDATLHHMKQLLQACDPSKLTTDAAREASARVQDSTKLTEETARLIHLLLGDEHVQATHNGRTVDVSGYFYKKASTIAPSYYKPNASDVSKFHQLNGHAVFGQSFVAGVNVADLSSISTEHESVLTALESPGTTFADAVVVLCSTRDVSMPRGRALLSKLIERSAVLSKLIPKRVDVRVWITYHKDDAMLLNALRAEVTSQAKKYDAQVLTSEGIQPSNFVNILRDVFGPARSLVLRF